MSVPYWRLSAFYFFYFSTLGGFLPFWSLYLSDTGFNAIEIGELSALMVGTKIIAPNIWGWVADHTGKSLTIIRIASFLAALFFAGFLIKQDYFWFAWVTIGFSFFWNAALPQFEAATLFHLKEQSHRYSQIRLWGSIGFIASVLIIGRVLDEYPIADLPIIITIMLMSIWLVSMITPEAQPLSHELESVGIFHVLKKPEVLAFLAVYMFLQLSHGPYYVFYSILLQQNDYSGGQTGLLWALGVLAEVILFIFMRRLLKYFSLRRILLFSLAIAMIRWLLIAWCAQLIWLLVLAQLMHAATFGAAHACAIHLVHLYFGNQHQGKGQALYSSLSFGLGGMIGSFASGYLWDIQGAKVVYTLAAIACMLAFIIAFIWVGREKAQIKLALS